MAGEKDTLGDKLHDLESARESQWAAERDRELLEKLRRKRGKLQVIKQATQETATGPHPSTKWNREGEQRAARLIERLGLKGSMGSAGSSLGRILLRLQLHLPNSLQSRRSSKQES